MAGTCDAAEAPGQQDARPGAWRRARSRAGSRATTSPRATGRRHEPLQGPAGPLAQEADAGQDVDEEVGEEADDRRRERRHRVVARRRRRASCARSSGRRSPSRSPSRRASPVWTAATCVASPDGSRPFVRIVTVMATARPESPPGGATATDAEPSSIAARAAASSATTVADPPSCLEGRPSAAATTSARRARLVDDHGVDGGALALADDERDEAGHEDRGDEEERDRPVVAPDLLDDPPEEGDDAAAAHRVASTSPPRRRNACSRSLGAGLGPDLRARAPGDDLAGPDEEELVAAVGLVHDVAGDDDRRAAVGERAEVRPELDPEEGIDADGRLVEEEDGRPVDERAGERQPPPLAARQGAGHRARSARSTRRALARLAARRRRRREEAGVLADRERRVDAVALGHVADPGEDRPRRHRRAAARTSPRTAGQIPSPASGRSGSTDRRAGRSRCRRGGRQARPRPKIDRDVTGCAVGPTRR